MLMAATVGAAIAGAGFGLARLDGAFDPAARREALLVLGSESLRPLVAACAEDLVERRRGLQIVVRGGGTQRGLDALRRGEADLAMASRPLSDAERRWRDEPGPGARLHALAHEAIAIVVHPSVPVDALTLQQLARVLDGTTADWQALGGPPLPVAVVGRLEGSGTAAVVEDRVLAGGELSATALRLPTHDEVLRQVAATPGAIGYVAAGFASQPRAGHEGLRTLALAADADRPALRPEAAAVARGDYPLARPLGLVGIGPPTGAVAALIEACSGEAVKPRLAGLGLLPVQADAPAPSPARTAAR